MNNLRHLGIALLIIGVLSSSFAQPTIQWQKTFGGSNYDEGQMVRQTSDGGYVLAGTSASTNGDVFGNHGGGDFWILKLNAMGSIQWKKLFGGSQNDILEDIQQLPDGGFAVVGWTASNDFDVTGQHGETDGWVIRLNEQGSLLWQKAIGGSLKDYFTRVALTPDNGFVISGYSTSNDGDVSWNNGDIDFWLVKLDSTGTKQWDRSLGGSHQELARCVISCTEGGYIAVGETYSTDGDVSSNFGSCDYWVVKLHANGELEWQQTYGGEGGDTPKEIIESSDGGYIVIGHSGSNNSGQVFGHKDLGFENYWVIKISSSGELEWQRPLGGSEQDWGESVVQMQDGAFIVAGYARSDNGDVSDPISDQNVWLVKLSPSGDKIWDVNFGGTLQDNCYSVIQTNDGGIAFGGFTRSNDGDLTGLPFHGGADFWVVKLASETTGTADLDQADNFVLSPIPAISYFQLEGDEGVLTLYNMQGQIVLQQTTQPEETIEINYLQPGMYLARLQKSGSNKQKWSKLLITR
ncbi:MAG: T9SS type A sorting domain-containing protein [Saprospiraceae bacterium]|nr:T9SS type A sorting domain-containing protein [Saprospiraceae bacterium]